LHIGNLPSGPVVDHRVGDGDHARRQQRLGLYQSGRGIDMTVRIVKRMAQLERNLGPGRKHQFTLRCLAGEGIEYCRFIHVLSHSRTSTLIGVIHVNPS
jgi:hypothetical protein